MDFHDAYLILDLSPYFNNDGISSDADRADGDFTEGGKTYPEEDLPASNSLVECGGVAFRFPDKRDGLDNNISLEGQRISVPQGVYDRLYVLGVSRETENLEDFVRFFCVDGHQEEAFLGLSGWYAGRCLKYGERVAIKCSGYHIASKHVYMDRVEVDCGIWMQKVSVCTRRPLMAIEFPDNPWMHIFAMTLRRACASNA